MRVVAGHGDPCRTGVALTCQGEVVAPRRIGGSTGELCMDVHQVPAQQFEADGMGPLVIGEGCRVSLQRHHRLVFDSVEADGEQASPIVV